MEYIAGMWAKARAWLGDRAARYVRNERYVKIRTSAALVMLAGIMTAFHPRAPMALVCAGMGFAFFGDAMLMQYPPIRDKVRQYYLWGMACFAVTQTLYARAMWLLYTRASGNILWPIQLTVFLAIAGALVFMGRVALFSRKQPLILRIGATLYALLVAAMAGGAVAVCFAMAGRGWMLLTGGLLFFLSDSIIALNDFGGSSMDHKDAWIWFTYVAAQILLILGTASLS